MAFETPINSVSSAGITIGTSVITSGTDTRVLFNDGGFIGEDAGFTYVKGTNTLTVATQVVIGETGVVDGSILLLGGTSGQTKIKANDGAITSYTWTLPASGGGTGSFVYDSDGAGTLLNSVDLTWDDTTNELTVNTIALSSQFNSTFIVGNSSQAAEDIVLGNGYSSATPSDSAIHPTLAVGTDIGGADLSINGGMSTGNKNGGSIKFLTSPAAAGSGSSANLGVEVGSFTSDGEFNATAVLATVSSAGLKSIHELGSTLTNTGTITGTDYVGGGSSVTFAGTGAWTGEPTIFNAMIANVGQLVLSGTQTINSPTIGTSGVVQQTGTLTHSSAAIGVDGRVIEAAAGGTMAQITGVNSAIIKAGAATVTNMTGFNATAPVGAAVNAYGMKIGDYATGATTEAAAIKIDAQSGSATINYGILQGNVTGGGTNYAWWSGLGVARYGDDVSIENSADLLVTGGILDVDGVGTNDFEGSLDVAGDIILSGGSLFQRQGTSTASATNLTLPTDGNAFKITGTTTIDSVSSTAWQNGSRISLHFSTDVTVTNNAGGLTGDDRQISFAGGADFQAQNGDVVEMELVDSLWIAQGIPGALKVSTVSSTTATVRNTTSYVIANAQSSDVTLNLPLAASSVGWELTVFKDDTSANIVTIDASGSETINGELTKVLTTRYQTVTVACDGDEWYVKAENAGAVVTGRTPVGVGNYTVLIGDYTIGKTAITGGGDTVTLPSGVETGQEFVIKDEGGTAATNNITVATAGAENIDGASTLVISANFGKAHVYFNGTNYLTK